MNPPRKAQVPVGKGIIFAGHKACVSGRFASKDERMAEYLRGEERESRQRWDGRSTCWKTRGPALPIPPVV